MLEEVIERLKAGTPEEDIAEWLASKLRDAEAVYRMASYLGGLGDDLEFEYGVQCGVVGDLLIPLAREKRKTEYPVR